MSGEFQLRPEKECGPYDEGFVFNNAHEQGARALAAALLEVYYMRERDFMDRGTDFCKIAAAETRHCINDIHRLVPPGAGKENA